jgi:pimeloyl-ACP methyl ester carboxylesterase
MADDTAEFIASVVGRPANLIGWSDGANVSLLVAIAHPELVSRVVSVGGNYKRMDSESELVQYLAQFPPVPNPRWEEERRSHYEPASPDGVEHWEEFQRRVFEMWTREPNVSDEQLASIRARTLVVSGDDDAISLEHTIALYRGIPDAELAVLPGTSHSLLREKPELANRIILDFLGSEPVPTLEPLRRRTPAREPLRR